MGRRAAYTLEDCLNPALFGMVDRLAGHIQREIDAAVDAERNAIVRYLHGRAAELGNVGYQLAEDVDMGLHHNEEGE